MDAPGSSARVRRTLSVVGYGYYRCQEEGSPARELFSTFTPLLLGSSPQSSRSNGQQDSPLKREIKGLLPKK